MKTKIISFINKEFLASLLFFLPLFNYFVSALLTSYGLPTMTIVVYSVISFLSLVSYYLLLRSKFFYVFFSLLIISILFSIVLNPKVVFFIFPQSFYTTGVIPLVVFNIPIFLLFCTGLDLNRFLRYGAKFSVVVLLTATLAFLNYVVIKQIDLPDYMTFAYFIVSPVFLTFIYAVTKNRTYFLPSFMGTIIVLIGGSRGALLTILIFYFFCYLNFLLSKSSGISNFLKLISAIAFVLLAINSGFIFSTVRLLIEGLGYDSRALTFFSSLDITKIFGSISGDGRAEIWAESIRKINLMGYGIFGDRTILFFDNKPVYAHNWVLEVILNFGLPIGLLVVSSLLMTIFMATYSANLSGRIDFKYLSYSVIVILLVKHMISASYLNSLDFCLYAGIAINFARQHILKTTDFNEHKCIGNIK